MEKLPSQVVSQLLLVAIVVACPQRSVVKITVKLKVWYSKLPGGPIRRIAAQGEIRNWKAASLSFRPAQRFSCRIWPP